MAVSNLFVKAFDSGTSGCHRECACGKVYFDGDGNWDWDEGELEDLRSLAERHPDIYEEWCGAISTMDIGGNEIVIGCSCDLAEKYENLLRRDAVQIANFLNSLSDEMIEEANSIRVESAS